MRCEKCWVLEVKDMEIKQLKEQQKALLETMQLSFSAVSLWAQATGLEPSNGESEEDIREELAEGTYFGDIYADPEMRDTIVIDESENSWTAYDDGAYTSNNVSYRIVEQEVVA